MDLSFSTRRVSKEREIQIPMDVVTEILTRLPAKSLMKFKCVSKLWASLIRSQYFSDRFLMVPSQQRLFMWLSDLDDDRNSGILSSAPLATTPSSFVVNHDLTIPCVGCYVLQNLRGFVCYSDSRMPRIYNPTTTQIVTLPAINPSSLENDMRYYFGLSINGVIYYLGLATTSETYNYVVASFDIGSEEFKTIQAPMDEGIRNVGLIEYGGKVALFDHTHLREEGTVDLWVVEDGGNKEWSKKILRLQPCQLHLVNYISCRVKGTSQSGKVLLIPRDLVSPFYILCYDLESNDMRKIDIEGIPDHWFSKKTNMRFNLMFMDQSENITYLET